MYPISSSRDIADALKLTCVLDDPFSLITNERSLTNFYLTALCHLFSYTAISGSYNKARFAEIWQHIVF